MPPRYLLHVLSEPRKVSEDIWTKWYTEEHIRDMVYFEASKTSALYLAQTSRINSEAGEQPNPAVNKSFFALYQCERPRPLDYPEYREKVRLKSSLWDSDLSCLEVGDFEPTNLELVEVLGDASKDEGAAPYLVQVEIKGDGGKDVDAWMISDFTAIAAKMSGYKRTLIYQPGDPENIPASEGAVYAIALHEFDKWNAGGDLQVKILKDEWDKSLGDLNATFELRGYKLLAAEGFGGRIQIPERL